MQAGCLTGAATCTAQVFLVQVHSQITPSGEQLDLFHPSTLQQGQPGRGHCALDAELECSERPGDALQTRLSASPGKRDEGQHLSSSISSDKFDALVLAAAGVPVPCCTTSPSKLSGH